MLWLHIQAPFAACRPFVAGWFRPTAGFLTHSAAYGLILNIAGIESRLLEGDPAHDNKTAATLIRTGLPLFKLALGSFSESPSRVVSVYQQLHNYPVGSSAGTDAKLAKGRKNNIAPVRREILCDIDAVAVIKDEPEELLAAIRRGLSGEASQSRYGVPFLGDNNYTLDTLEEIQPRAARWYAEVRPGGIGKPREGTTRLTIRIDRADMSKTVSGLFAPGETLALDPPPDAFVEVGPAGENASLVNNSKTGNTL